MYLIVDVLIELAHEQHVDPLTPATHCILKRIENRRDMSLLSTNQNK